MKDVKPELHAQCLFVLRKETEKHKWTTPFSAQWNEAEATAWGKANKHTKKHPDNVTTGSGERALWRCDGASGTHHLWHTRIDLRCRYGTGCRQCKQGASSLMKDAKPKLRKQSLFVLRTETQNADNSSSDNLSSRDGLLSGESSSENCYSAVSLAEEQTCSKDKKETKRKRATPLTEEEKVAKRRKRYRAKVIKIYSL